MKPETVANINNTKCFSKENFAKLQRIMTEQKISAGSPLFLEGDAADTWFYIIQGSVKMTKSTREGREFILYLFHEGDLLGQLDPYPHSMQSLDAFALADCVVGTIYKPDLDMLLRQNSDLANEFMSWLGLMHRMAQTKFRDLMMYGKWGALCSTLIRMGNTYGQSCEVGIRVAKKFTHTELADYIGAARESVNRMLVDLKKANVIDYKDGYITIINMKHLKEVCYCESCPKEICRI